MLNTIVAAAVASLALTVAPASAQASAQDATPAHEPVALSAADAVSPVSLPVDAKSVLRLETNPSTGYGWQVVETVNLKVDEPFEIERNPATAEPMVGAPETALIRFMPRGVGPASLVLVYKRPWMATSPDDRTIRFVFDAQ